MMQKYAFNNEKRKLYLSHWRDVKKQIKDSQKAFNVNYMETYKIL